MATKLPIPVVGVIKCGQDNGPEIEIWEEFAEMFNPPPYNPQKALDAAKAVLPVDFHEDWYYLPLALIYANVPALAAGWKKYCFTKKPSAWPIEVDDLKKHVFKTLSSGELFLAILGLHLFNDFNKLPKDGLLGLRNLDSHHFELAMHAIRISSKGPHK